jgi:hypothetical protein
VRLGHHSFDLGPRTQPRVNLRQSLEDHAVTLAVKGPDLHHAPGHYSAYAPDASHARFSSQGAHPTEGVLKPIPTRRYPVSFAHACGGWYPCLT